MWRWLCGWLARIPAVRESVKRDVEVSVFIAGEVVVRGSVDCILSVQEYYGEPVVGVDEFLGVDMRLVDKAVAS